MHNTGFNLFYPTPIDASTLMKNTQTELLDVDKAMFVFLLQDADKATFVFLQYLGFLDPPPFYLMQAGV